jgi:hypothetical protein
MTELKIKGNTDIISAFKKSLPISALAGKRELTAMALFLSKHPLSKALPIRRRVLFKELIKNNPIKRDN